MRGGRRSAVVLIVAGAVLALAAHTKAQSPAGQLRQAAYIKASNPGTGDHFACGTALDGHAGIGISISGDGNTMAVGAPHESSSAPGVNGDQNNDTSYSSGAVYVFTRAGNGPWKQQAYLKASNPGDGDDFGDGDQFGYSVSLNADGNILAVWSYDEGGSSRVVDGPPDNMRNGSGAVYIFARTGGAWKQTNYIKAANAEAGDEFGGSLALSRDGRTIVLGSRGEDSNARGVNGTQNDNSVMDAGAAYVFAY